LVIWQRGSTDGKSADDAPRAKQVVVGNETESEKENRIVARKNTLEVRTKKRRNEETWR